MASLSDMMTHKLIKRGDTISFTFKGNHFSATILDGGMIGKCTIKRVHDTEPQVNFFMRSHYILLKKGQFIER